MEKWKVIKECPDYSVSNQGNVLNNITGRLMKQYRRNDGYCQVKLTTRDGRLYSAYTHRLVALNFLEPCGKAFVNHRNGRKHDNHMNNLEWATGKENMRHSVKMKKMREETDILNLKEVKIGYKRYKIYYVPYEHSMLPDGAMGYIYHNEKEIYVCENLDEDVRRDTLLHEIFHGIDHLHNIGLDEQQVETLGIAFYTLVSDNKLTLGI